MNAATLDELKRRLSQLRERLQSVQSLYSNLRTAEMVGIVLSPEQRRVLNELGALSDEMVLYLKLLTHEQAPHEASTD